MTKHCIKHFGLLLAIGILGFNASCNPTTKPNNNLISPTATSVTSTATIKATSTASLQPTPLTEFDPLYGFTIETQIKSLPKGIFMACWNKTFLEAMRPEDKVTFPVANLNIPSNMFPGAEVSLNGVVKFLAKDRTLFFVNLAEKKVVRTDLPGISSNEDPKDVKAADRSISPNGKNSTAVTLRRLYLFNLDTETWIFAQFVPWPDDYYGFAKDNMTWSFDGTKVAFWFGEFKEKLNHSVYMLDVFCFDQPDTCATEKVKIIGDVNYGGPLAWTPDDNISVIPTFVNLDELDVYDTQSFKRIKMINLPKDSGLDVEDIESFYWSPDSQWIVFKPYSPSNVFLMPSDKPQDGQWLPCNFAGWLVGKNDISP